MTLPLVRSKLLPVPHGFPTREGGVSVEPYASLNLGFSTGDDRGHVEENVRRLAAAGEFPVESLHVVSQVHGDRVVEAPTTDVAAGALRPAFTEADAIVTAQKGATLGIRVADCIPLLLVDAEAKVVSGVHSGWKGTDLQIAARAVEAMEAKGARRERILAAVGPHIRACCYEVSQELADRFTQKFGPEVVRRDKNTPHLDLAYAVRRTLLGAGVQEAHVDVLPHCTSCDSRFYSHRRDRGVTGRHLCFVRASFQSPSY